MEVEVSAVETGPAVTLSQFFNYRNSCSVDFFFELAYYIFFDSLQQTETGEFLTLVKQACLCRREALSRGNSIRVDPQIR